MPSVSTSTEEMTYKKIPSSCSGNGGRLMNKRLCLNPGVIPMLTHLFAHYIIVRIVNLFVKTKKTRVCRSNVLKKYADSSNID